MLTALSKLVWNTQQSKWANFLDIVRKGVPAPLSFLRHPPLDPVCPLLFFISPPLSSVPPSFKAFSPPYQLKGGYDPLTNYVRTMAHASTHYNRILKP